MLLNSKSTKSLIILPQNLVYRFHYRNLESGYQRSIRLKNMLPSVEEILSNIVDFTSNLRYEPTTTIIGDTEIPADFYFENCSEGLTRSNKSEKVTTVETYERQAVTTLNLFNNHNVLIPFMHQIGWIEEEEEAPAWMDEIVMFDDKKQRDLIDKEETTVEVTP